MHNEHKQEKGFQEKRGERQTKTRRRFLKQGSLVAGVTSIFSLFGITPFSLTPKVSAASNDGINITPLDTENANDYIHALLASEDYHRFESVVAHKLSNLFTIQRDQIKVAQITVGLEQVILVSIPVTGGAGYSFYNAVFQPDTVTILHQQNALFKSGNGENIVAVVERNGQTLFDGIITPEGNVVKGTILTATGNQKFIQGLTAQQLRAQITATPYAGDNPLCCFLNALVQAGILSVPVAILLGAVCAGACVVTIGAGCIACVGVAGLVGGALLGAITYNCTHGRYIYPPIVC